MRVELFPPDPDTEPRHWVRHDQAFAMMLGPGSIEWGLKRSSLEKFDYVAGDLALCHRHEGEWVGLMNVPHLQIALYSRLNTVSAINNSDLPSAIPSKSCRRSLKTACKPGCNSSEFCLFVREYSRIPTITAEIRTTPYAMCSLLRVVSS